MFLYIPGAEGKGHKNKWPQDSQLHRARWPRIASHTNGLSLQIIAGSETVRLWLQRLRQQKVSEMPSWQNLGGMQDNLANIA